MRIALDSLKIGGEQVGAATGCGSKPGRGRITIVIVVIILKRNPEAIEICLHFGVFGTTTLSR
jgi:hypothetical protein